MLKNTLNTFFFQNIEKFNQSVLTSIPLKGIYDPDKPTGPTTTSGVTGSGIASPPPPTTTPYIPSAKAKIIEYTLRSGKKPNVIIPYPDPKPDPENPGKNLEFSQVFGLAILGADGTQTGTYDSIQSEQLQLAFDTCARYDDCWGITIANGDYGMSAADIALSSTQSYFYRLVKKPNGGDLENLTCDPKYYTYLKNTSVYAYEPNICKPVANPSDKSIINPNPKKTTSTPSNNSLTAPDYFNSPPSAVKASVFANPIVIGAIVCVIIVLLITIVFVTTNQKSTRRR
jgi:hypothetical protein